MLEIKPMPLLFEAGLQEAFLDCLMLRHIQLVKKAVLLKN